jgi:hypothetical protein
MSVPTGMERGAEVDQAVSLSERVAQTVVICSSALAAAGLLLYLVGAFSKGYDVVVAFSFGLPICLVYVYAARRLRSRDFTRAALVCFVGGLLTLAEIILVGLSAPYADPCFEVAHCTRGPTFAYVALTGATIVFVLTGVLGLVISPVAITFSAWRWGKRTTKDARTRRQT